MKSKYILVLGTILAVLSACKQNTSDGTGPYQPISEFEISIDYPSGSLLPSSVLDTKVPTIFNVGQLGDNIYGMVLGPSIEKGEKINYKPIGLYSMVVDSTALDFVLCVPDGNVELINANNYNEWSLNEIRYKSLIDNWFRTNCELNNCSEMDWSNDLKALRILEQVQ